MSSFSLLHADTTDTSRCKGWWCTSFDHLSLKRLNSNISGPVDGPKHTSTASDNKTSNMRWRHAINRNLHQTNQQICGYRIYLVRILMPNCCKCTTEWHYANPKATWLWWCILAVDRAEHDGSSLMVYQPRVSDFCSVLTSSVWWRQNTAGVEWTWKMIEDYIW